MIAGVCKFCGCTERRPCIFAIDSEDPDRRLITCAWLLEDVCNAPACVEKAYAEACRLVDEIVARELAA